MIQGLPAIVLARPMDENDPLLYQANGHDLYPRILNKLIGGKLLSKVILSVPNYVPKRFVGHLKTWGHDLHVSEFDCPQARLMEVMDRYRLECVVVLTPYFYIPDESVILSAVRKVCQGPYDLVFPQHVVEAKYFLVMNRKTAKWLSMNVNHPLPPFAFPQIIGTVPNEISVYGMPSCETGTENFLWKTLYQESRNIPSPSLLSDYLSAVSGKKYSSGSPSAAFLKDRLGISKWGLFSELLDPIFSFQKPITLAHQIIFLKILLSHLPETKNRFLEVGFGYTPVTACILSALFKEGICSEPTNYRLDGISLAMALSVELVNRTRLITVLEDVILSLEKIGQKVTFVDNCIENMELADNSIDFCYSFSVFEHICNVNKVSEMLYRALRPGGKMIHGIGFMDHQDMTRISFDFLRYSIKEWALINSDTNLWRINDICTLWEKTGFEISILQREVRISPPDKLHTSWQEYQDEDLYCYWAVIEAVKT